LFPSSISKVVAVGYWDEKYESTSFEDRSWSQRSPGLNATLVTASIEDRRTSIIDIGSGASRLFDDLLEVGFTDLTALDISPVALDELESRIGPGAKYICTSFLEWEPDRKYGVAHDRAVFHFLTESTEKEKYKEILLGALADEGIFVIGTFGPQGPEQCSGLPVSRWSVKELQEFFDPPLQLIDSNCETHETPWGSEQQFSWAVFKKSK
jgi:hypothetical protein